MRYLQRWTVALPLLLVAMPAAHQQAPQLELSPASLLVDESFRVGVSGLEPGKEVTIRMAGRGVWHSQVTLRADGRGRVDVPDPMRLVWSATGDRPLAPGVPGPQPWVVTVEDNGKPLATGTILRHSVAADVRILPVRERGLVGTAYVPPGTERRPAVIVLPGSGGGIPGPGAHAGGLASRGYVVLALAYFNSEGLPPLLQKIPLEYFETAVEWLKSQAYVDSARVGVLGTSRGGELALLLGATYPAAFRVVVANVPSSVVWPGLSSDEEVPAWTLKGQPIGHVPGRFSPADLALSGRDRFLKRMKDPAALERAAIPVERIGGPVLLLSAKDDQVWPSDVFAGRVVDRLKARGFSHPVEHYSYENAGHGMTRPHTVTSDVRQTRLHSLSKRPNMMGGTPEGQARANADSWEKVLAFLDRYLRR